VRLRMLRLRVEDRRRQLVESGHQYNWVMDAAADTTAPLATLLENHQAFLRYLERRVGDRALAEDILQEAFAKVVARPEQAPADEAIVPWFHRTLRNAAIDQFRRRGAADRAYEAFRATSRHMRRHQRDGG
jgi:DNA-directed RNA polymerase specialized sigma24 family protein